MRRSPRLTRAQRRAQRPAVPAEGVYGVDADDAGADSWTGRYLMWAFSPEHAAARITAAGFHRRRVRERWTPGAPPPEGTPDQLTAQSESWYRSRWDDSGWTRWQQLPPDYRHPSQVLAARDPSVR